MGLELEVKRARGAPAAHFGVIVLVSANRRGRIGHIRRGHQQLLEGLVGLGALGACSRKLLVNLTHLRLGGFGLILLALLHECADFLGGLVALGLQALFLGDARTTRLIELAEAGGVECRIAVLHGLGHGIQILADKTQVQHGGIPPEIL